MSFNRILHGVQQFQKQVYPKQREFFHTLAHRQSPAALFITCADSRIDPCLLTQAQPGDLFVCRVIGNVVPRYPESTGGVSATIEYAVGALAVPDVIVCGHTDCGVMKGVLHPQSVDSLPNVSAWLRHALPAREAVEHLKGPLNDAEFFMAVTERNVVEQLNNLKTHPSVAVRLEQNKVKLHGWVYHIARGAVTAYDTSLQRFVPLSDAK